MKQISLHTTIAILLLMLISATAIAAPPASKETPPLAVQFSLETPKAIVLGEPIILSYRLGNPSLRKVGIKEGNGNKFGVLQNQDNIEWLTLTMTDAKGDTARPIPQIPPAIVSPFGPGTCAFFNPGDQEEHEIVVTRYLTLSKPGNYTLSIHVHLPYAFATNPAEDSADRLLASSNTVFRQDISIPITVQPADPQVLEATAHALTQRILQITQFQKSLGLEVLTDALCTMPEAQAGPSWQTLASVTDHTWLPVVVADALARRPSNKSADILAEVAWEQPAVSASLAQDIGYELAAMYNAGSPSLRAHIKTLYVAHSIQVGETIPIPTAQD